MKFRLYFEIPFTFVCMAVVGLSFPLLLCAYCVLSAYAAFTARAVSQPNYARRNWPLWMDLAAYAAVLAMVIAGGVSGNSIEHAFAGAALFVMAVADVTRRFRAIPV